MSTISIIGSGGMAAAIGGRIANAKYTVEVIDRDPAKARALADKLAAGATTGKYGARPVGDIVVLAVPYSAAVAVVGELGSALDGKIILDITNPVSPDATGLVTPGGSSGAQEIARRAPAGAPVVKALNTLFGPVLARGGHLDAFLAADDPQAKARVSSFLATLGLRPLDVGGLHMAQTLESLGLMLIGLAKNGAGSFDIAMNVQDGRNVQVVKDFFAAIGRTDLDALRVLATDDIEWVIPGEGWPLAGTHRGHAGLEKLLRTQSEQMETSFIDAREFVPHGDRLLVVGFAQGKIKSTNKSWDDHWVFAITLRGGKVANIREYMDTQALARAAGANEA